MSRLTRALRVRARTAVMLALLFDYGVLLWRTAWVSDDAFISLRTAANMLDGYGLRWNVAERVQTFTHPLWLAALTAAHAITREPFYSTIALSCAVSMAALAHLLFGWRGRIEEALVGMGLVLCSHAFIDFSTSGLENPLTHLLLAGFALTWLAPEAPATRYRTLALLAGLAALNRLDSVLLFAPVLVLAFPRDRPLRSLLDLAWGGAPLLAWEIFSVIYYGFPFPNTAYAKLGTGIAGGQHRLLDGSHYFQATLRDDPVTLGAIALACTLALFRRDRARLGLLAGALLYLGYTLEIGGDFMAGRFFSAPFFVAIACLVTSDWLGRGGRLGLPIAACAGIAIALSAKPPPPATGRDFGSLDVDATIDAFGIHDERAAFFQSASLLNASRLQPSDSDHPWSWQGHLWRAETTRERSTLVKEVGAIGFTAYYAGPRVHVIDQWALADPLIARLPALFGKLGHYTRVVPPDYLELLRGNATRLRSPQLDAYWAQLERVTRGPIGSAERWAAIWAFNTGRYDHLIEEYAVARGSSLDAHVRVVNTTGEPNVVMYVWNDGRLQTYFVDTTSVRGKTYDVRWRLSPLGAELLQPQGSLLSILDGIHDTGALTIGVSLGAANGGPLSLHELRYGYVLREGELIMVRDPWRVMNPDFPTKAWREVKTDGAIEPLGFDR